MPQSKQINVRIDEELLAQFKQKAESEYGSMSRFLKLQIESYVEREPLANDAELTALMYAVKALNQFAHDINAITGQGGKIPSRQLKDIRGYADDAIQAFKNSLAKRRDCFQ